MKKAFLFLACNFISLTSFAQWTQGTNLLYTTTSNVTLGAATVQGNYAVNDRVIEIVSPTGYGSYINLKSGANSMFLTHHSIYGNGLYLPNNQPFDIKMAGVSNSSIKIQTNGNVGINTALNPTDYKLAVGGKIIAEELKVQLQSAPWPDYVFGNDYKLPTLEEIEKQIKEKGHLVNMPSAEKVNCEGFEVGELTRLQQEKIEELTLYIIKLNQQLQAQEKRMQVLEAKVNN